jgi:hypothetical protein
MSTAELIARNNERILRTEAVLNECHDPIQRLVNFCIQERPGELRSEVSPGLLSKWLAVSRSFERIA